MIDPSRGARIRRGGRRPGWILMTVLLVLAIAASSALVFTNRVELLKLAVILALWAAVVAAFVSVIYRRQSDADAARVRDQKLVYDLQLDREISARREYELSVESQLRRELASELRAQSADEVSALRAELAALRANLEFLFDTDLSHRHAIETDRNGDRAFSDWTPGADSPAGRVSSSRIDAEDTEDVDEVEAHTEESPIIDVPAEPHLPEDDGVPLADGARGAHRRFAEGGPRRAEEVVERQWPPAPEPAPASAPTPPPPPPPPPQSAPPQLPWLPPAVPPPPPQAPAAAAEHWQPAPAEGQWLPPGTPGSNWVSPPAGNGAPGEYVGRRRAGSSPPPPPPEPPSEPPRGRHYGGPADAQAPPPPPAPPTPPAEPDADEDADGGAHTGGQSVAELLARLQSTPSGGGRRRRRED